MKTRKGWKTEGRRVLHGTVPAAVEWTEEGKERRLFSFEQTVSEEAYLLSQKETIEAHGKQWAGAWCHLEEVRLSQWMADLSCQNGPEAESGWLALIQERERLLDRRMSLAPSAKKLDVMLPEVTHTRWHEALRALKEHRFQSAMQEANVDHETLARQIDKKLLQEEEETATSAWCPMPFWHYFGRFHKAIETVRFELEVAEATRIREFHALFPARDMQRHFTLYLGPTNSGKTFQALQRLKKATNGVYLAPLRLLALEVSETLQSWGVPCSMITGEERIEVEGASHTASTIEMLSLHRHYDMCVIDEAQMLGDADRGWAWTQAILGVQADEVCVIAAPEARPVIEKLLRLTGDPFNVVMLERLTPLKLLAKPVKNFKELEHGTAIVAFSRAGVLAMKGELERQTGERVAVLYGALPPEVRRFQAALFASGQAPYLVATDAIGMGLNLPIQILLFSQDTKFFNHQDHPLTSMEVRQIGGRAGRFGKNEVGYIGSFKIGMSAIASAFNAPPALIKRAHLAPSLDHLQAIAELSGMKRGQLARLLFLFSKTVKPDPAVYKLTELDDQTVLARIADRHRHLDLATRFVLSAAPVPLRATLAVTAFERMVEAVAKKRKLALSKLLPEFHRRGGGALGLLETSTKIVNLYSWLHYRFPEWFPDLEQAIALRRELNLQINRILGQQGVQAQHCTQCSEVLPKGHPYRVCDPCHSQSRSRRQERGVGRQGQGAPYHGPRRGGRKGRGRHV